MKMAKFLVFFLAIAINVIGYNAIGFGGLVTGVTKTVSTGSLGKTAGGLGGDNPTHGIVGSVTGIVGVGGQERGEGHGHYDSHVQHDGHGPHCRHGEHDSGNHGKVNGGYGGPDLGVGGLVGAGVGAGSRRRADGREEHGIHVHKNVLGLDEQVELGVGSDGQINVGAGIGFGGIGTKKTVGTGILGQTTGGLGGDGLVGNVLGVGKTVTGVVGVGTGAGHERGDDSQGGTRGSHDSHGQHDGYGRNNGQEQYDSHGQHDGYGRNNGHEQYDSHGHRYGNGQNRGYGQQTGHGYNGHEQYDSHGHRYGNGQHGGYGRDGHGQYDGTDARKGVYTGSQGQADGGFRGDKQGDNQSNGLHGSVLGVGKTVTGVVGVAGVGTDASKGVNTGNQRQADGGFGGDTQGDNQSNGIGSVLGVGKTVTGVVGILGVGAGHERGDDSQGGTRGSHDSHGQHDGYGRNNGQYDSHEHRYGYGQNRGYGQQTDHGYNSHEQYDSHGHRYGNGQHGGYGRDGHGQYDNHRQHDGHGPHCRHGEHDSGSRHSVGTDAQEGVYTGSQGKANGGYGGPDLGVGGLVGAGVGAGSRRRADGREEHGIHVHKNVLGLDEQVELGVGSDGQINVGAGIGFGGIGTKKTIGTGILGQTTGGLGGDGLVGNVLGGGGVGGAGKKVTGVVGILGVGTGH